MPLELGTALSIDREPVNDPEIRIQALEAIYLIILQVNLDLFVGPLIFLFLIRCYILEQTRFGEKCVLECCSCIIDTKHIMTQHLLQC